MWANLTLLCRITTHDNNDSLRILIADKNDNEILVEDRYSAGWERRASNTKQVRC